MSSIKKTFDTVQFQRKVREQLREKYLSDREGFLRELKQKYGPLIQPKAVPEPKGEL